MRSEWLRPLFVLAALAVASSARAEDPDTRLRVLTVNPDTLVLERTRPDGRREGLVIDSRVLVATLKARVLEARGLGEVAQVSASYGLRGQSSGETAYRAPYVFQHRFAEPFEAVAATLRLEPLREPDEGALLYPLIALLTGAVIIGLYALYRMTAAQVLFAERRSNFVSAVSHELKTPLTAIRMYSEMLSEDLVDDTRRREYYRTITAESERLSRLINNVLELSRIQKRHKHVELRVGNIEPIVEEVLSTLRPHARELGFELQLESAHGLPAVQFEPDALKQVLFNLIDNGLKYARDSADRRVVVYLVNAGGRVSLSVRDFGAGVPESQLPLIFEPFYRVEAELTRKHQGTGIGLSLVKGLVERMGGRVYGANRSPGFEVVVELARPGI